MAFGGAGLGLFVMIQTACTRQESCRKSNLVASKEKRDRERVLLRSSLLRRVSCPEIDIVFLLGLAGTRRIENVTCLIAEGNTCCSSLQKSP
jgi:hypothetical protein